MNRLGLTSHDSVNRLGLTSHDSVKSRSVTRTVETAGVELTVTLWVSLQRPVKTRAQRQREYRERMKRQFGDAFMRLDRDRKARKRRLQKEQGLGDLWGDQLDSGAG